MAKRALKKTETKVYKEQLVHLRARLRGDVTAMADSALNGQESDKSARMPIHMADIGTDNFEQEFTLSLLASEEDTLDMIEAALERIEDGVYGLCQECGSSIPKARLNALPYTPFCVKCAEKTQMG
jgi:DnaK suppressor protein